ncbi:efflux RND transporter permease subunit [Neptunitalea lumnitzerae]|uniref:Multidrug transporter AcrB n=1 Tax=Neptunitalea lumnitzerae TaxID=2965509 RepID=A0ABQ5MJJ1_9FLAO|nr:efflux RND transporter permease subunit [Neptunitalea sp. Y10]GLB49581.1 multidrug transporter AcrB [Neptunitalea sp. Y10]
MTVSELAIKRPLLIVVIFTVLILFGVQSYLQLNYNLLPKIEVKTVSVVTIYPGASASEVALNVTKKLEDNLASVEGLKSVSSKSQEGVSQITLELKSNVDIDEAERNVQRKVDQSMNDLPDDVDNPTVSKIDLEATPVISAGVTAIKSPKELYQLIDDELLPVLQNTEGVGQVNVIGGTPREIKIAINQDKLIAYKVTVEQVITAIANANRSYPAGKIETKNQQYAIKFDANFTSIAEISTIEIKNNINGGTIYLKDIASVVDGTETATTLNHINGVPSIGIQIIKQSDANAVNVSEAVREQFTKLENQYPEFDLKFKISSDQSEYTLASADAVMEDLVLAVVIVGIVMLLFLHSLRSSLFVMVALPSSIIPTFIAMYVLGFSLNLMTLMAMSLVVGILVDDSIVVLENIYRHLEMGSEKRKAALDGRNEIGFTAMAITLVDVVVFLPLAMSGGIIGSILKEFSLVVVFSTLMSLMVSFTITPLLASRFGRLEHLTKNTLWGKINIGFENLVTSIKEYYGMLLQKSLGHRRWVLIGVLGLLISSFLLVGYGFIGGAFIPSGDQGELLIKLELAPATSVYQTNMVTRNVETILLEETNVETVFSSIGYVSGGAAGAGNNSNMAELTVSLKEDRTETADDFGVRLQKELSKKIPGVIISASPTSVSGSNSGAPIQIAVKGIAIEEIRRWAETIKTATESVSGTKYVKLSVKDPKPQIEVVLNRDKMTQLGINANTVGMALQSSFNGNDDNKFKHQGNEYNIAIALDDADRSTLQNVENLAFINSKGASFQLSQFATIKQGLGESVLERKDRLNSITVNANVVGRPVGTVAAEIKEKIDQMKIPDNISIEYLGDVKNQGDAFGSLGIALLTAIILVYLIMVALYESVVYPFVVLFSIPVALIGALLALALTMESLNIFSIIGMIMLLGLVSKNGILIVDFTNQLKEEGHSIKEALVEAGKERLRPILMTTMAMILGMLPIALASGEGSEIKNGMAWVIIGGLTSSMLLTLFVVPIMYSLIEGLKGRLNNKRNKTTS